MMLMSWMVSGGFSSKWHGKRNHVSFERGFNQSMEGGAGA